MEHLQWMGHASRERLSFRIPGSVSFWDLLMPKLYDVPVGFVSPPLLRQCIAIFAVTEGWLLLDIGFVLFLLMLKLLRPSLPNFSCLFTLNIPRYFFDFASVIKWSMHCYRDIWLFDPEIPGAHLRIMGCLCVRFHDYICKGKAVMQHKTNIRNQCIVTLTFQLQNQQDTFWTREGLCLKFHIYKGTTESSYKAKPFSVINASLSCSLEPKNNEGISSYGESQYIDYWKWFIVNESENSLIPIEYAHNWIELKT